MTPEPSFIDNRDGNTLAQALGALLGVPPESTIGGPTEKPDQVSIATAFFSPTGFAHIADHLEEIPRSACCLERTWPPECWSTAGGWTRPRSGSSEGRSRLACGA